MIANYLKLNAGQKSLDFYKLRKENEMTQNKDDVIFPTQEEQEEYFDRLEEINEGEDLRRDAEICKGEADVDRWRFNRDFFGEDYAAAEELAWDLRYGDW
jgi:hypothetical protein